jgi:iron-sulfur cluster assembly protein
MAQAIQVTDIAKEQAAKLIAARGKPTAGIRVGVRTRGCSGLSYTIEYADDIKPYDEVVEVDGFKVLIDPKAIMFVLGTVMDYKQDKFKSGFEFVNPNEKGRCGCGESFTV